MILRLIVMACALCAGTLSANLEDHFKKPLDKGTGHQIKNVDFIYLLNLDERPEKFEACMQQLRPYGIEPYRFSAVNGWKLTLEDINDVGLKYRSGMRTDLMGTYYPLNGTGPRHEKMTVPGRTYFCHCTARGTIGIALSHLSMLQDALDSGYETVWIMEDDISVKRNPLLISEYIEKLDSLVGKNGWDMLFMDQDEIDNATGNYAVCLSYAPRPDFSPANPGRFAKRVDISKDFRKIGARYDLYSFIIRRSGMKKILNFAKKNNIFLPIDMDFTLPNDIRIYTVIDDIIGTQRYALSDNGVPRYSQK